MVVLNYGIQVFLLNRLHLLDGGVFFVQSLAPRQPSLFNWWYHLPNPVPEVQWRTFCKKILSSLSRALGFIPDRNLQRRHFCGSPHLGRVLMHKCIYPLSDYQDERTHLLVSHKIQHKGIWQIHAMKNLELTEWKLDYIYHETQNTGCCLQTGAMTWQLPACLSCCFYASPPSSSFTPLCCWLQCLSDLSMSQRNSQRQLNPEKTTTFSLG